MTLWHQACVFSIPFFFSFLAVCRSFITLRRPGRRHPHSISMYPLPFYEGDRFRRRQIADNTQGTSTDSTASSHTPFDWSAVLNHGGPPSTLSWTAIVKYATAQKQLSDSPSPQGSNQQHGQQSGPSGTISYPSDMLD